jgi:hypothetical protein
MRLLTCACHFLHLGPIYHHISVGSNPQGPLGADFYFGPFPQGWRQRHTRAFMQAPTAAWMFGNTAVAESIRMAFPKQYIANDPHTMGVVQFLRYVCCSVKVDGTAVNCTQRRQL